MKPELPLYIKAIFLVWCIFCSIVWYTSWDYMRNKGKPYVRYIEIGSTRWKLLVYTCAMMVIILILLAMLGYMEWGHPKSLKPFWQHKDSR